MDDTTRALERAYRESGSPRDGAAWLQARVRTAELAESRLEIAAVCGDLAARAALEGKPSRLMPLDGANFSLGAHTVQRLRSRGSPTVHEGRRVRFDLLRVLAWLEAAGWHAVDPVDFTLRVIHFYDRAAAVFATLVACGVGNHPPRLSGAWIHGLVASWERSRDSRQPEDVLREVRSRVVEWALGPARPAREVRHEVRVHSGQPYGEVFELELDTFHEVHEVQTGRVVLSFFENSYRRYPGSGSDWGEPGMSGVAEVELAPDGWHVRVREHDGAVALVPLPE